MSRYWIDSVPRLRDFGQLCLLILFLLLIAGCGNSSQAGGPAVDRQVAQGKRLFNQNCVTCHTLTPNTTLVGPSLSGVAVRAAGRVEGIDGREYLLQSIIKPSAYVVDGFTDLMPTDFGKSLDGEQLDALLAYLLTLT